VTKDVVTVPLYSNGSQRIVAGLEVLHFINKPTVVLYTTVDLEVGDDVKLLRGGWLIHMVDMKGYSCNWTEWTLHAKVFGVMLVVLY
ncbi:hypothetical protein M8C21_003915, partial [Ambrosia artemisiifolia]